MGNKEEALSAIEAALSLIAATTYSPTLKLASMDGLLNHAHKSVLAIAELKRPRREKKAKT